VKRVDAGRPTDGLGEIPRRFAGKRLHLDRLPVLDDDRRQLQLEFDGNPLSMAAARATLDEVLTPEAYPHLESIDDRLVAGCQAVIERYGLPGYTVGIGSKGCVTFAPGRITDYASFRQQQDAELTELAWLYNVNRDIFMTPGREEEWTLSVAHQPADADGFVAVFEELAADLTA
jgi:glutamate-1-semialdehyde 2,1-aminomutase